MKTKLSTILLCCIMVQCAYAQKTFVSDGICYKIETNLGNRVSVCNVKGTNSECKENYTQTKIVIPDSVTYNGKKYPVTRFEQFSFKNCKNLDTIIISDNVKILNMFTFENCRNLKYVKLPNKVEKINMNCFYNCISLESITIPASVTIFTDKVFEGCTKLANIYMLGDKPSTKNSTFSAEFKKGNHTFWVLDKYYKKYQNAPFIEFNLHKIDNIDSSHEITFTGTFNNDYTPLTFTSGIEKGCNIDIAENAEYRANQGIEIKKRVDTTRYHFISLPFDCAIKDITTTSGETVEGYASDWMVLKYDGEGFAQKNVINWISLGKEDILKAGEGYIIGISNSIDTKYLDNKGEIEFVFPEKSSIVLKHCHGKSSMTPTPLNAVTVKRHPSSNNALKDWNLIGTNLLHTVNDISIYVNDKPINYVSIPNKDGKTYNQTETKTAKLNNFTSFFIQSSEDGKCEMKYNNTNLFAIEDDERIEIVLSDTGKTLDKTTILVNNTYSDEYEYNVDLLKLQTKDAPQIYSVQKDGTPLCYSAIPYTTIDDMVKINVTVPETKEYTLSLTRNDICNKDIILIDKYNNTTINLAKQNYTFVGEPEYKENRFTIYSAERDTATDIKNTTKDNIRLYCDENNIKIEGIEEPSTVTIYNINGTIAYKRQNIIETQQIENVPTGNYIITIENDKTYTYKINVH